VHYGCSFETENIDGRLISSFAILRERFQRVTILVFQFFYCVRVLAPYWSSYMKDLKPCIYNSRFVHLPFALRLNGTMRKSCGCLASITFGMDGSYTWLPFHAWFEHASPDMDPSLLPSPGGAPSSLPGLSPSEGLL